MALHSSHQQPMRRALGLIALPALVLLLTWLVTPLGELPGHADYVPLHTLLETTSIVIAVLIFAVGFNSHGRELAGNVTLLASMFLGVALLDFSHALSFQGMPHYVTPSGTEKAISFWLAARTLAALVLLAVALLPWRPYRSWRARYLPLAAVFALTAVLHWVFLFHADLLPRTFEAGTGLTPFKIRWEFGITGLNLVAAVVLWRRMRGPLNFNAPALFGAVCMMALSEFAFTLFTQVTDVFNLLGHVFKTISYLFLYRAIFVEAIERPYRQLSAARGQLKATLETIPDMVWVKDLDGVYLSCNLPFARLYATTEDHIVGRRDTDFIDADRATYYRQQDRNAVDAGKPVTREEWLTFADTRHAGLFAITKAPMFDAQGQAIGVLGIGRDITAERQAQQALLQGEQRLQQAVRVARTGIFEHDHRNGQYYWSPELRTHYGIGPDTPPGLDTYIRCVAPQDRERVMQAIQRAHDPAGDGLFDIDHRVLLPNGEMRVLSTRAITQFDGEGAERRPLRTIGAVTDVTAGRRAQAALKQLNEQLEQRVKLRTEELERARDEALHANRAKSQFLSSMSHELRTPLNAVLGFGQLLLDDTVNPLPARQRGFASAILRAAGHLLELINDVLDLARVEAGKLQLTMEPVDVAQVCQECIDLLRPIASEEQIELIMEAAPVGIGRVIADRIRLKQVLLNLVSNAIKYNRKGGTVTVSSAPDGGALRITVTDTGRGLNPAQLSRLFNAFERLGARQDAIEGTGIGLVLSRQLVEAMGGSIGVSSQAGTGSTFWLRLPHALGPASLPSSSPAPAAASPATTPAQTPGRQFTVLYVEDDPINAMLMENILAAEPSVRLITAASPGVGLDIARAQRPDLVLLDLMLPGMDGFAVLRRLRDNPATRAIPVIAVSANAMREDIEKGLSSGFADYMTKPLDVLQLRRVVMQTLRQPAPEVVDLAQATTAPGGA